MPNSRMADAQKTSLQRRPCGIIRIAALWVLCRYRHKTHWTGHPSRLDRSLAGRFGSDAYAMEELIAELAAAMIGAELGLPVAHLDNHASYLASWLRVLKADSRAILSAAAKAEEASAFLLRFGSFDRGEMETGEALALAA